MTTTFQVAQGDVVMDERTGRPKLVADKTKLRQDLLEMLSIERQPSGFGAGLVEVTGRVASLYSNQAEVARRVRRGIEVMQVMQQQFHRAERPDEERISRVAQLVVAPARDPKTNAESKTSIVFRVDVLTVDGDSVAVGGEI